MKKINRGDAVGGSGYFKPGEFSGALGFIVEPKRFQADVPNPKFNNTRNILTADITVFRNKDELSGEGEPLFMSNVQVTNTYLALDMEKFIDEVALVKLVHVPGSNGGNASWKWRPADVAVEDHMVAYIEAREAELADTELPSF